MIAYALDMFLNTLLHVRLAVAYLPHITAKIYKKSDELVTNELIYPTTLLSLLRSAGQ